MLRKKVEIDGREVEFKASAAVPRIYRMKFRRDLFVDLQKIAKSVKKKGKKEDKESSEIPIEDLEMFENIAYVMAQHADPENVPPDIMDWLEQFNTFSIYQILPAILELWNMNEETKSRAKKNLDRVAGSYSKADTLLWLSLAPNVTQGGQSYSFTDESGGASHVGGQSPGGDRAAEPAGV